MLRRRQSTDFGSYRSSSVAKRFHSILTICLAGGFIFTCEAQSINAMGNSDGVGSGLSVTQQAALLLPLPPDTQVSVADNLDALANELQMGISADWQNFTGSYADSNPIVIPVVNTGPTASEGWNLYE